MNQPFFSLITPVYNIERLISKTIESALEQTFIDWEMILIDDGSPDRAGVICDEYAEKDDRIRVVHKKNEGLAAARNTGINECKGKYFLIFEGSDILESEHTLQDIYDTLCENEVDIYFARLQDMMEKDWKIVNVQDEYCVKGFFNQGGKQLFIKLYDNDDVLALSSPVNKVFRSDFVKQNGIYFYPGIYHDDDEWLPRAIALSETSYFSDSIIYNALTWDGCLGQNFTEVGLTKKACDKMLIAEHCCKDIDNRFSEKNTEFKKKYYEYYVRMYIDGIISLNTVKDHELRVKINNSISEHQKVFDYAAYTTSRNLWLLAKVKKIFGINTTRTIILNRYNKNDFKFRNKL